MKLLIGRGWPVGEAEIDAASRGSPTRAFGDAIIMVRMNAVISAQNLARETTLRSILPRAGEKVPGDARSPVRKGAAHEPAVSEGGPGRSLVVVTSLQSRGDPNRSTACLA